MNTRVTLLISSLLALIFSSSCQIQEATKDPVAILGAFYDEIAMLHEHMEEIDTVYLEGIPFLTGMLSGTEVVVAYTGIGKVNAAMTTALTLHGFHPRAVIFTGIAGAVNPYLHPADLLIAERCVQHDLNYIYKDTLISYQTKNPATNTTNPVFFETDSSLLNLVKQTASELVFDPIISGNDTIDPGIYFGTIATGDAFVASSQKNRELMARFQADAVEMEGAAVAQVCYQQNVPFLIIRSISDKADENARIDILEFYRISAENANKVVLALLQGMAG